MKDFRIKEYHETDFASEKYLHILEDHKVKIEMDL